MDSSLNNYFEHLDDITKKENDDICELNCCSDISII